MAKANASPIIGHSCRCVITMNGVNANGDIVDEKSYTVTQADTKIGQKKAFEIVAVESGVLPGGKKPAKYRIVQYLEKHADGRWHDCECPSSRFNRAFACKHVAALVSLGMLDANPEDV